MGNCQAAEAATVVIQHGGNRVERIYWSVSADEVMNSNPGHYVALVVASPAARTENGTTVKQLKLLRPDDTLLLGQVYRLVSFEEVMKEFAAKKCAKLGKLLKLRGAFNLDHTNKNQNLNSNSSSSNGGSTKTYVHRHVGRRQSGGRGRGGVGRHSGGGGGGGGGGQWRPALQTITELGI